MTMNGDEVAGLRDFIHGYFRRLDTHFDGVNKRLDLVEEPTA